MSSIYPDAIDGYAQLPLVIDTVTEIKSDTVNRLRAAIVNIETELGVTPSSTYADVSARLDNISAEIDQLTENLETLTSSGFDISEFAGFITQVSSVNTVTTDTTLTDTNGIILVDASASDIAITLPSASISTKIYRIKKIDSSNNSVFIYPPSGETLDGESYFEINFQYDSYSITNNSSDWFII